MISKLIPLVLEMATGKALGQAGQGALARLSMKAVRRVILLCTCLAVAVVFFSTGLFTVVLDLVLSSRDAGGLTLSPVANVGFALMGLSALTLAVSFRKSLWRARMVEYPSDQPSPLNGALAELVKDFVEERRAVRQAMMEEAMMAGMMREERAPRQQPAPQSPSQPAAKVYEQGIQEPPPVYM